MSENLWGDFLLTLYIRGPYTQFCTAGLQDSSAEEPKMHQNFLAVGAAPGPHCGSSQRSGKPPSWCTGRRGKPPLQEPGEPSLAHRASSFGPRFAPAMLISYRRHRCWKQNEMCVNYNYSVFTLFTVATSTNTMLSKIVLNIFIDFQPEDLGRTTRPTGNEYTRGWGRVR